MWIYDNVSEEMININEHIHNIYVKDYSYDSGIEYKIHFKHIQGNGFSIQFKKRDERDNYFEHIMLNVNPIKIDSTKPPIKL